MTSTASQPTLQSPAPVGAVWHRVALQVNPFGYQGMNAPSGVFSSEGAYNQALIDECQRLGISLIAVTDHWAVDRSINLIEAAEAAGIAALPGMEVSSSEGIHLLVLFERHTQPQDVVAMIGACGGTPGCHAGHVGKSFSEIVQCAVSRNAVVVPAHVNGPNGLLTGLESGAATIKMWQHPEVHAVAVSPGVTPAHQRVLDNAEPAYLRSHAVAVLHAGDICEPTRLGTPAGSCWVKMATPSLAALKLAFRTPTTRTSLEDPSSADHPVIDDISWEGGFLDGVKMRLSSSMTCLIGGRGTGKSTVVESLRFALGLDPIGKSAERGHKETVGSVLGPGTRVAITLRAGTASYTVERTAPDPPIVRNSAGTVLVSTPVDLLESVEVFSQHELAELAESTDYIARLLRRLGTAPPTAQTSVRTELHRNREDILSCSRDLDALDDKISELPRHREALARFESEGLDARLAEKAEFDRQRDLLRTAYGRVDSIAAIVESLRDPALSNTESMSVQPGEDGGTDKSVIEIFGRLETELSRAVDVAQSALTSARTGITSLEFSRSERDDQAKAGYKAALRTLQDGGFDGQRYLDTRSAVQTLTPLAEQRPQIVARLGTLRENRRTLLEQLAATESADRKVVAAACRDAGQALRGTVRVRPLPSADRAALHGLIDSISGQRHQIKRAIDREDFSPGNLADAARRGPAALTEHFDIRGAQADALAAAGEPLFLALEEMTVPTAAQADLNVDQSGGHDFRPLNELSQGQKATALLLLLLTSTSGPLIIDQPEDDLDNRFIWEGVVPRLRTLKAARQLILSTHNANIPVLGDAELVIALDVQQRKGRVVPGGSGSLDDESVRVLAEQILEGGREAFDRRRYLYGF